MPPVIGLSHKHIVMVDLDGMPLEKVKRLADLALKRFRLGGYVILESSPNNYHVVFDRPFRYWSETARVMAWIAIMSNNPNVKDWVLMQEIKEASTLRVSPKPTNPEGYKPTPKIVYQYGSRNLGIKAYLKAREEALKLLKELKIYKEQTTQT
ncbi:MAG: hypothetical protein QXL85_08585 [Candidatus Bathyarchaeia archaeon]